ncbi:hypothetical protein LRS10_06380 [Phenylobacterium sp. J426]|uniref:hypothetical protein n=1 Tax=Phenylobacterium sp. J426 TaxID=2898439 RepID=UPI00215156E8|nr:hypothetical protein [Phenylobacterium sp. J426]MCR5873836.1 hypothetical protein [Phenylobacterium sp. J426]
MNRRLFTGYLALVAPLVFAAGDAQAAGGEKAEKKLSGGPTYVPIQTVLGTTKRADGRRGVLSVECGLDVPDDSLRERATMSIPRLRSAYMSTVQTYASGLPAGEPPNVDFIARALQQQTDAVLGRRGAKLLLGAVMVN